MREPAIFEPMKKLEESVAPIFLLSVKVRD